MDIGRIWLPWHLYHTCQGSWRRGERPPPNASSWPRASSPSSCISHMAPHTYSCMKINIENQIYSTWKGKITLTGLIQRPSCSVDSPQPWWHDPICNIMTLNFHDDKDQTNQRLKPGCQRRPSWTCPSRWTCRRWWSRLLSRFLSLWCGKSGRPVVLPFQTQSVRK